MQCNPHAVQGRNESLSNNSLNVKLVKFSHMFNKLFTKTANTEMAPFHLGEMSGYSIDWFSCWPLPFGNSLYRSHAARRLCCFLAHFLGQSCLWPAIPQADHRGALVMQQQSCVPSTILLHVLQHECFCKRSRCSGNKQTSLVISVQGPVQVTVSTHLLDTMLSKGNTECL